MTPFSMVALFCEDIREEKNGAITLIGVFPDKIEGQADSAPEGTPVIPKLCVYIRAHFDPTDKIVAIPCKFIFPNGEERELNVFDAKAVIEARNQCIELGVPLVGIFSRIVIPNFPVYDGGGRLQIIGKVKNKTYVAGTLNIGVKRSSNASERPS